MRRFLIIIAICFTMAYVAWAIEPSVSAQPPAEVSFKGSICITTSGGSGPCAGCTAGQMADPGCNGSNNTGYRCVSIQCSGSYTFISYCVYSLINPNNYCVNGSSGTCSNGSNTCYSYTGACETTNFDGTYSGCNQPGCPGSGGTSVNNPSIVLNCI